MEEASNITDKAMKGTNNFANKAKAQFMRMLKDKRYWVFLFLVLVIILVVFLLSIYTQNKYYKKETNAKKMKNDFISLYEDIPTVAPINQDHKHLLRDYYVASSYNSCVGGSTEKDWVGMIPLQMVIKSGARLLDFEVYSKDAQPIIAAGPGPNTNGKYCLKGTYNSILFRKAMNGVKLYAMNGRYCENSTDPLFLNFRIKSNNPNIYDEMAKVMKDVFGKNFLEPKYRNNGLYNKSGGNIANIPLLNLREKVIIIVEDPNKNYEGSPFEEYINISGSGKNGTGMPYAKIYPHTNIIQTYSKEDVIEYCKKYLGICKAPPEPNLQTVWGTAMGLGVQFVMMKYNKVDGKLVGYLKWFSDVGSSFRLKVDKLRYFDKVIPKPKKQKKELSYGPRPIPLLGGDYNPSI